VIAIVAVLAAVVLRLLFEQLIQDETPFLLMFAAVLVSAAFGGLGPGLLATLLGAVASSLFIEPRMRLTMSAPDAARLSLFLLEGVFISVLAARLQAARRRAEQSEAGARQLEQKILDISDAERRRIGQDLHDGLGQQLTGVAFLSKALQQRLAAKALPEAEDATKIASLVSESIGQSRALAKGLAPLGLEDGGLPVALNQLAASTTSVFGLRCTCRCDSDVEVADLAIATQLYRIAQEAVNNAIRHGKAKHVMLNLGDDGRRLRLSVEDDGIGIAAADALSGAGASEDPANRDGLGLQIMRFRARMIGGSLEVSRRNGGGTLVLCVAPLRQPDKIT
jgi:signal transduction histidine kinase